MRRLRTGSEPTGICQSGGDQKNTYGIYERQNDNARHGALVRPTGRAEGKTANRPEHGAGASGITRRNSQSCGKAPN